MKQNLQIVCHSLWKKNEFQNSHKSRLVYRKWNGFWRRRIYRIRKRREKLENRDKLKNETKNKLSNWEINRFFFSISLFESDCVWHFFGSPLNPFTRSDFLIHSKLFFHSNRVNCGNKSFQCKKMRSKNKLKIDSKQCNRLDVRKILQSIL